MPVVIEPRFLKEGVYGPADGSGPSVLGPFLLGYVYKLAFDHSTETHLCGGGGEHVMLFYPASYSESWSPGEAPDWHTQWCTLCGSTDNCPEPMLELKTEMPDEH